jgi:lipid II:glycine glycyltransferase (peptidoglycan interpeptide bridge formation enzyme)
MLLPSLHGWIKSQRLNYAQITLPGSTVPPSDMADKIEPLDNLELNLQPSLEKLWKSLSTLPQRCIRKAVKAGVRIHWRRDSTLLADQRLLVAATYGRQGIHPNIPESLYETLLQHQSKTGLRVLCSTHGGKTVASVWVFTDTRKCYYWDAAALAESRDLNANHLLVWTLIRWAHRKRFQILDFVGTSVGGRAGSRPGIGRFKQSMGARAVEYRILYWHSPLMRLALDVYRRMQRLRARLQKK